MSDNTKHASDNHTNTKQNVENLKQKFNWLLAVCIILGVISIALSYKLFSSGEPIFSKDGNSVNTLSFIGTAEKQLVPDTGTINLSITETAATTDEANQAVAKKIAEAMSTIKSNNVSEGDVKQLPISTSPRYEGGMIYPISSTPSIPSSGSQQATQSLEIKVELGNKEKNDAAAKLYTELSKINNVNLYLSNFDLADRLARLDDLRTEAIKNARAKADKSANALGVKAGRVVNYKDSSSNFNPIYAAMDSKAGGMMSSTIMNPTSLTNAEITLSMSVEVVFAINR